MATRFALAPFALSLVTLAACGGSTPTPQTAADADREVVEMDELRITARQTDEGLEFDSYDAETLFYRATELLNSRRCPDAVTLYDRLADEFPGSRYRSPALYNAGLCLADTDDLEGSVARFERLIEEEPQSPDVKHATFNLAKLLIDLEHYDRALETADRLLRRTDLSSDERMEAMARRSQALLGRNDLDDAERTARMAVTYYRTRPEAELVNDPFFAAAANFVLADAIRRKAAAMAIPEAEVERQREVLERRAQYMLRAQREYFNTMSLTNAHWAAAAGYEIGAMYDKFWQDIMSAPTPPPRNPLPPGTYDDYADEYRHELARLVEPLIRHAIRYWELTLMMVERTQSQTPWATRIREDLERARQRLITQPGEPPMPDDPDAAAPEAPPSDETGEALSEP